MDQESIKALMARGLYVFPLAKDKKSPAAVGWQEKATNDPGDAEGLERGKRNLGVFTGRYAHGELVVLDLDNKPGKNGLANIEMLFPDLPRTFTVQTASGGRHYYFSTTKKLSNSVGEIAPGVDIRAQGGLTVAPGSELPHGRYTVLDDAPIAPAPSWLEDRCAAWSPKQENREAVVELDLPYSEQRAIEYLKKHSPIDGTPGNGANNKTFEVACMVKDFGVSEANCLALMLEHFERIPPWTEDVLSPTVASAYRNSREAPGSKATTPDEFEPVSEQPASKTGKPPLPLIHFAQCKVDLSRIDLIEDWLSPQAMSVVYGPSNVGKTFVALDMSFHIAAGWEWMGKHVSQAAALYIAAEGGLSIQNRAEALKMAHGSRLAEEGRSFEDIPLFIVPAMVDLRTSKDDALRIVEAGRECERLMRTKLGHVTIDTLSRALAGGKENAAEDMTAYVEKIDLIRQATGAHVGSVHHCGKDEARGARGHSSLRAATDTEIEINNNTLFAEKQRDMEASAPIGFELETVELGINTIGKAITSCLVRPASASAKRATEDKSGDLKPREAFLLDCFVGALRVSGRDFVTDQEWRLTCRNAIKNGFGTSANMSGDSNAWATQFKRSRQRLEEARVVSSIQENQWVKA